MLKTYGNQTKDYVDKTSGPMRLKYPKSVGEKELITSLTKVAKADEKYWTKGIFLQDKLQYNAYEKDIAIVNIFFGEPTVYGELQPHITPKILLVMDYDHWQ